MTTLFAPAGSRHGFGFWVVGGAFLAVLSFSAAPSPLYVLYSERDHFSSLIITLIYAAYAAGVAASLFLASHLSDVPGRRLLAQYAGHPLTLPYLAQLALLIIAGTALLAAPGIRQRRSPLPAYRPQRVAAPGGARVPYYASLAGIFLAYAGPAVFIGLAGTFLAAAVHDTSLAMAGFSVFVVFAVGMVLLSATSAWPARSFLIAGVLLEAGGLALVVTAARLPSPSLALFLAGGGVIGAAATALFKGTLGTVIAVGITLRSVTPRGTLLAFAIAVTIAVLAASPVLLGKSHPAATSGTASTATVPAREGI